MPRSGLIGALGVLAGGLLVALAVGPAAAASTARASDPLTIYAGPGYAYPAIGTLPRGAVVSLAECTSRGTWCRIVQKGPQGWVLGSYLIGSAAKVEATPWRPLGDPLFMFGQNRRHPVP